MQKDRTDHLTRVDLSECVAVKTPAVGRLMGINPCPPIPSHTVERRVYVKAVPSASSLRYVFNTVMTGQRGAIGWDQSGDSLILYLQVEEIDHIYFPDLAVGVELWASFQVREQ